VGHNGWTKGDCERCGRHANLRAGRCHRCTLLRAAARAAQERGRELVRALLRGEGVGPAVRLLDLAVCKLADRLEGEG
jgi:hypothetical protein